MKENEKFWVVLTIAVVGCLALAALIVGLVALTKSPTSTPPLPAQVAPAPCTALTQAQINAVPSGGTFDGVGCYTIGISGITINKPMTVNGGTYTETTVDTARPVFTIRQTSDVTIENATISGTAPGTQIEFGAEQAGIKLVETGNVNLVNDTVLHTGGDCLEAFAIPPKYSAPNVNLTVTGNNYNLCGRDGISPSDVNGATFTNDVIGAQHGQSAVDFESDLVGLGAGNVVFNNLVGSGEIVLTETLTGPVTFNGGQLSGRVLGSFRKAQTFGVTFENGTLVAPARAKPAIVVVRGPATVTFSAWTFTRGPTSSAPLWGVFNGGTLNLIHCGTLPPPLGSNDSTSTVTVTP